MATLGDELYDHIDCYNVGPWLDTVFQRLGLMPPDASMPPYALRVLPQVSSLTLTIDRMPDAALDLHNALFIYKVEGNARAPMPRGLDPARETLVSARAKLSPQIEEAGRVSGDRRVSFFMPGGKVVELRFNPSLVGFDRYVIACLGGASDWKTLSTP